VTVPEDWIERLDRAADPAAEGAAMCADLVAGLREIDGVAGVHLMAPVGGARAIVRVLDRVAG
jgi:methylenetetrahydrofolate reductase (NADPH)